MTARHLEESGIATIVIGSAMDIVTHCNVPRYLHNDFPLGNPLGPPGNVATQFKSVSQALQLVANSKEPLVQTTDASWPGAPDWKRSYNRVDDSNAEELRRLGEENRRNRAENKAKGLVR